MDRNKGVLDEKTISYRRGENTETVTLEQQIQQYEKAVEQVKSITYVEKMADTVEDIPNVGELDESPVQIKIHKKRIAIVGTLIAILAIGSMLYQYVVARGLLEFPIYYLNHDKMMVLHENSGVAKNYTDFVDDSGVFSRYETMGYDTFSTAKNTKDGQYCLYPENISVVDGQPVYQLFSRKVGDKKGKLVAENVGYYEEVATNIIAVYSIHDTTVKMQVYDLQNDEKIEVGSGHGQVIRYMVSESSQRMLWVEMNQDGTLGLYHQNMDQSEAIVCITENIPDYGNVAYSDSMEYVYYVENEQLYMMKQFGEPQKIADDMSMTEYAEVGDQGELYLVHNKETLIDPLEYIEMDVALSQTLLDSIKDTEYYFPRGELYYYTPEDGMTFVTSNYAETANYLTGMKAEKTALMYDTFTMLNVEKIKASSISSAYDVENWIQDIRYLKSYQSICYKGNVILENKNITSYRFDLENDCFYYSETNRRSSYSEPTEKPVLKKIDLNGELKEEMIVDDNAGLVLGVINNKPYYLKENDRMNNGFVYDVYYDGVCALTNVLYTSVYYDKKNASFYGVQNYDNNLETGTLIKVDQDGIETVIMEEVTAYAILDDQRMLVITKNNSQENKMYVYYKDKMKQLDQGKIKILSQIEHFWNAEHDFVNLFN